LVLPAGIRSDGFPAVRETCRQIGIGFDRWQADLNRCLLAKDEFGIYAADTAVLSIPRQVGKTFDVAAVAFALCITSPGLTVVWTAHRFKVSRESFMEMRAWAKRRELIPHIDYDAITTGAGTECIPFRNGSRIVFAARERGSIRGFTKVGMLVLDEAQILTETALADLVPTTNQSPNPLIILMGTPPKPTDPSEVFVRLRDEALEGVSSDVLYVEFSAERGSDPDDEAAWRVANPSYPKRTPRKAILRMRKLLNPDNFLREALGIWDEAPGFLIDPSAFAARFVDRLKPSGPPVFFLDVSMGMRSAAIGVAARDTGPVHLEVAEHRPGTDWLVDRVVQLQGSYPDARWCCSSTGLIGVFLPELEEQGIEPEQFNGLDMGRACGHLQKLVADKSVTITEDRALTAALVSAVSRDVGDGMWAWNQRKSASDISPLNAVTGAAWGHAKFIEQPTSDIF
jgi:phage terminase large subunit-like protein